MGECTNSYNIGHPRNAKDAFIEFCLMMDIGQTTAELEEEWQHFQAKLDKEVPPDDTPMS